MFHVEKDFMLAYYLNKNMPLWDVSKIILFIKTISTFSHVYNTYVKIYIKHQGGLK